MHRFLALVSTLVLSFSNGFANSGGPDAYGYNWVDSGSGVPYEWIDPGFTATTILSGNAVNAGNVTLDVPWGGIYGEPVSEIRVSRNGYITDLLTANGNDETNDCPLPASPSVGAGGWRIYPLHDNLELSDPGGTIKYQYYGESPHPLHGCGVHVITWENVYHFGNAAETFDFQALLFDNLDILFQYGAGNPENGLGSTTGIQNTAATIGLNVYCNEKKLGDDFAILVQPPEVVVNTAADELDTPAGAAVSLREAVRDAADGSRIRFGSGLNKATIDLSGIGPIALNNKALAIDASVLAQPVHLSGDNTSAHINLGSSWLSLENLYFEKGGAGSIDVGSGCTIIGCHSSWVANTDTTNGGAISLAANGTSSAFYRCDFMSNRSSQSGGAIAVGTNGRIIAEQCRFWRNASSSAVGGGAMILQDCEATLRECDIASNSGSKGGGLLISDGVDLTCFGCTFDDNRAGIGGAAAVSGFGDATDALFHYCTFFQNVARLDGGALAEATFTASLDLDVWHCTFYQNRAGDGGGAISLEDSTCHAAAIIMADNGGDQLQISAGGTLDVTFGDNIETGNEGGFSSSGQSNIADIALTDLGHFGGFVRTCVPLQNSPAIDAAFLSNADAPIDARGFPTFRDGGAPGGNVSPDVGAVEVGPTVTFNSNASFQTAIDTAEDGGVVAPSGIGEIALAFTGFTVPAGKTVFLDGSPSGRLSIHNLTADLDAGQRLAIYGIDATADTNLGGLHIENDGQLAVDRCSFTGYEPITKNILDVEGGSASVLRTVICNTLSRGNHVAIKTTASTLVARDTAVQGCANVNSTAGGINTNGGAVIIQRCSITGNRFRDGGSAMAAGIGVRSSLTRSRSWALCENNTISGNTVSDAFGSAAAGGIAINTSASNGVFAELAGNTVVGNTFTPAGAAALHLSALAGSDFISLILSRNIFAENTDDYNKSGIGVTDITAGDYNLSDTNMSILAGNDITSTDPKLGSLVIGPHSTRVHVPLPGSPCIDASPAPNIPLGASDGRLSTRSLDGNGNGQAQTDIGAVESGRVFTVTTASDESNGGLGLGAGDSLRECIAEAISLGAGNIGFDAALNGTTISMNSGIGVSSGLVDVQGAGGDITLTRAGSIFIPAADGELNLIDLTLADATAAFCNDDSRTCVSGCTIISNTRVASLQESAHASFLGCRMTDQNGGSIPGIHLADNSTLLIDGCLITENGAGQRVLAEDNSRAVIKNTTITQNASRVAEVDNNAHLDLFDCTVTRNGRGFFSQSNTAPIRFARCVIANNNTDNISNVASNRYLSLGGNLFDTGLNRITSKPDDISQRAAYLAPLADYDDNGIEEMPLLSASAVFGTGAGAASNPTEIITVTTTADENDSPAGAAISLREAVRDVEPGGTIVFDPALNNTTLNAGTSLELPRDMTIDATSLPLGIDLTTRLFGPNTGVQIALHGIHIRDVTTTGVIGGAVTTGGDGFLAASHCAFSNIDAAVGTVGVSSGAAIVLENCTFAENTASVCSGVFMNNGAARIEFCTFGDGQGSSEVIAGAGELELYACAFFGNVESDGTTPATSIDEPPITFTSGGYNVFPDTPSGANGDDITGFTGVATVFMDFDDYAYGTAWVGSYQIWPNVGAPLDVTPAVGLGVVPPPEHDARGIVRVFGSSADAGAHENAGELVDSDGDTLPDWWELLHGLDRFTADDLCSDEDGDETSLEGEFIWRLDPHDPAQFQDIGISENSAAARVIDYQTRPGYVYVVDISTDLETWTTLPGGTFGDGSPQGRILPASAEVRNFYMLRLRD